jgi:uncharacterized protein
MTVQAESQDRTSGTNDNAWYGEVYHNAQTGYMVVMEDDAGLLSDTEREALAVTMQPITGYGNVAFKSIVYNSGSTSNYAWRYYAETFSGQSGILFLIDMDNRNIWIYCDGDVYRTIDESYADTITDNVYRYASRADYYQCAAKAYEQAYKLLQGRWIARPMKYICNALLAIIMALLINFGVVSVCSKIRRTGDRELLAHTLNYYSNTKPTVSYERQTKRYDPIRSDDSSGGSSGGGGGGGHSSGGGGGHSF